MARDIIFVPFGGGDGDRAVAQTARTLSETLDAVIEAVFVGVDEATVAMAAGDAVAAAAAIALREERARDEAAVRALAEEFGFALTIHAGARSRAAWRARLAVLAIVDPLSARGDGPLADVFEALLLEERAPVLVPRGAPTYDKIAVAWDGSREAANALKAAEPLIARARSVRILQAAHSVDAKDLESADPERVRHWVRGRNENAEVEIASLDFNPSRSITMIIESYGPVDLIVAGAYGHARLREAVLGGATRSLLHAKSPSLLLAH
jgi:nucleotide-binding universal stress UspA family protein